MKQHDAKHEAEERIQGQRLNRRWRRGVWILAALVAVVTVTLLILPAITLESQGEVLRCQLDLHAHTNACYGEDGTVTCGYADFVIHTHNGDCYNEAGQLICPLEEIEAHTHDAACYRETSVLICGEEETAGHTHTEACYESTETLICGQEETEGHAHTEACYEEEPVLICEQEESEEHTHTEACYESQKVLTCGQEEAEGHTHDAACYEKDTALTCGEEEAAGHTHTAACYESREELVCGQEEIILHTHDSSCFDAEGNVICGKLEVKEHVHDESCQPAEEEQDSPQPTDSAEESAVPQDEDSWATVSKPGYTARKARLAASNAAQEGTDFGPYITEVTVSREVNGQWVPATEFASGDSVRVTIRYSIPENVVGPDSRTIYYQLPSGIGLAEEATGNATIGNEVVGTYVIQTDGLITITFDQSFADNQPFTGELGFQGVVTATGGEGEEEIIFGGDGGSITIVPKEEETDISIAKTGEYQRETNKLAYTIEVSTQGGTDGAVSISDAFLHEASYGIVQYDEGSFQIVKQDADGAQSQVSGYNIAIQQQTETAAATFTITGLPELQAGEAYLITYTATPDLESSEGAGDGYLEFSNQAIANDDTDQAQARATTRASQAMIAKEGTYNELTQKIEWTIRINEDGRDISGYTLEDRLSYTDSQGQSHTISLPDTVTLTAYNGSAQVGESTEITLPYVFPEGSTYQYVVTYETDLPAEVQPGQEITLRNWAGLGEYEAETEIDGTVPEPLDYNVQKQFWGAVGDDGRMSWASWITYPTDTTPNLDSLMYVDRIIDLMQQDGTLLADSHYTTLSLLSNSLYVVTSEGTSLVYGQDFEVYAVSKEDTPGMEAFAGADFDDIINGLPWQVITSFEADEPLTLFGIQFYQSALEKIAGQSIIIGYQTQVAMDSIPEETLLRAGNYARIPDHEAYAYGDEELSSKLMKQASPIGEEDVTSYTDDALTLDFDEIGGLIHYRLLLSRYGTDSTTITVTDVLPEGAQLVEDSVTLRNHYTGDPYGAYRDVENTDNYYLDVTTQENQDGTTTVTFTFHYRANDFEEGAVFGIYYDVSVADDAAWQGEGAAEKQYTNIATWGDTTDSTTTTVKKEVPTLEKTGEQIVQYDEEGNPLSTDRVRYYITVNPEGTDLHPTSDTLTMTDTLTIPAGSGAAFQPDSVAVYAYDSAAGDNHFCGEAIDPGQYQVSYDSETHTITFTLPDSTPCVVVYDYLVDRGNAAGDLELTNRASLMGEATTSSEADIIIEEQSSSATVNRATMTIYKHDSANITKLLSRAAFELERYELHDGAYSWRQTSVTAIGGSGEFITGESGMIVLNFLSETSLYNTLYRLTELSAPEGYLPSEESYYFVWMEQGATEEQTIARMQESGAFGNVSAENVVFIPYSTSGTLYVPNEWNQLTVTKEWRDESGALLENPPSDGVRVTLYQWTEGQSRTAYETVELTEENGWIYTWTNLPRTDDAGSEYRYTVEEEHVAGFETTYSSNNDAGIQAGEILITNTQGAGFILPETGGSGTTFYIAAGLLLTGSGAAGYLCWRRKRRRKADAT